MLSRFLPLHPDSSVLLKKLNELTQLVSSQRNQMHSLRDEMKNVKQIAKNSEQKMIDAVKKKDQQAQVRREGKIQCCSTGIHRRG